MADTNRDGLDELTNSAMAASHIAKILQAAQAAGAAGAAAQTVKEFHRQAAVVIIVILLLPILLILSLPSVIFGSLITPSDTVLTDELEVAENVITIKNNIAGILQTSYEAVLEEIAQDSQGRYSTEIVDEVGGHVTFNALQILSMYCAHMGTEDYADISIENLTEAVRSHRDDYYSYTTETESRTELVDKVVNGTLIQVPEPHEYTTYTVTYAGDAYFADTIWQLSEQEQAFAADYAYSLTLYLRQIEQQEGISILEQINDLTADSTVPVAEGDFGNPFNDPAWRQHITSRFGLRPDVGLPGKDTTNHNGLDIAYGYGTPILAVQSGTVITATVSPSYGNYVVIDHGGGICTLYAHCSRLLVSVGQAVYQPLGRKEPLQMPTPPIAKQQLLSVAALCGELSPLAASRLIPSQSYRYRVLEELTKAKLLRPYRRDQVKGHRLTRLAKNLLTEQNPERYAALFTGSVRTNGYTSELSRRLRMHRLGEVLAMMQLGDVAIFPDEKPDLFGRRISPAASPRSAFYLAREIQSMGDIALKIKNARMAGVLLAPSHFYLVYNTGNTLMRWAPASELRARTLLTEYIGRRIGHPAYAGQNAEALLLCEDLSLAPTLFRSRGGGKRQLFFLDGTFDHMHLLSNNAQGDVLFQILRKPGVSSAFNTALAGTLYPKRQIGNFSFDALDEAGRPVLFAWDFDLVRIQSFYSGLCSRELTGAVIAFDFQTGALQPCLGEKAEIRPLSLERTRRMLLL